MGKSDCSVLLEIIGRFVRCLLQIVGGVLINGCLFVALLLLLRFRFMMEQMEGVSHQMSFHSLNLSFSPTSIPSFVKTPHSKYFFMGSFSVFCVFFLNDCLIMIAKEVRLH